MRGKRSNVCQNCRSKKLACDGAQPECSQCRFRRISCSGYKQAYVFVNDRVRTTRISAEIGQKDQISLLDSSGSFDCHRAGILELSTCHHELQENINFIVQHYAPVSPRIHNPICGAWVDVLPIVFEGRKNDQPLVSTITTLAAALRCHDVKGGVFQPQLFQMYCESLLHVSKALANAQATFQIEHCVAVICLAEADVVTPRLKSGWMTHAKAVGDMLEVEGPISCSQGIMHTIFLGFRPLLLMASIFSRRGTFLAREEWISRPFKGQPISAMQQCLNIICVLPALLEDYDSCQMSDSSNPATITKTRHDFSNLLASLRDWKRSSFSAAPNSSVWVRTDPDICLSINASALWFTDIDAASSFMHYWAFEILIRTHLSTLPQTLLPTNAAEQTGSSSEDCQECSLLELADMICDSIPYLLQPEMKQNGLWSAFFVLPIALSVFEKEENFSYSRIARSRQITDILNSRGVQFT